MTSQVKITACLAEDKQVDVQVTNGTDTRTELLNDGESFELSVYDDMEVKVKEVHKGPTTNVGGDGKTKPGKTD